jgi:MFS-type transporter involved in bile tolerance (Atg22 family)
MLIVTTPFFCLVQQFSLWYRTVRKINLAAFAIITAVGSFVLTSPEEGESIIYGFGALWGVMLGWFWPLESAIFAMTVPKGQESELAGFYTYCCTILAWLPPLIVTVLNESGYHMKWGIFSIVIFLLIGLAFLQLMAPWEELLAEAKKRNKMIMIAAS